MLTLSLYPYGLRRNEAFSNPLVKQGFQNDMNAAKANTIADVKAQRAQMIAGFRNKNEGFQGGSLTVPAIPVAASRPALPPPSSMPPGSLPPVVASSGPTGPSGPMPSGPMPSGSTGPSGSSSSGSTGPAGSTGPEAAGGSLDTSGNMAATAGQVTAAFKNYKQGFQNMPNAPASLNKPLNMENQNKAGFKNKAGFQNKNNMNVSDLQGMQMKEGFATNYAETSGGAQDNYKPMGAFDGVVLPTGNNVSTWRYTAPNEELLGAPFAPGDDSLFIFKNNQCKPECCGSSFSCSGGCICTTADQRQYIAGRGGNRTKPQED